MPAPARNPGDPARLRVLRQVSAIRPPDGVGQFFAGTAAAPFRRNDELLNLLPKGIILFPSDSGITANLADKAESIGIPVMRCG